MNPLLEAEQALLGAVLLDPQQLAHLSWLAPDHFYRPVHQALFAALRKLRTGGHPAGEGGDAVALEWVTDAVEEAGVHVRGLTAAYAHTLIATCPRPAHAPVYARMVLEGAIHRTVTEHAIRLHQAARADALQGEVDNALHYADVLTDVLGDLARRWGCEPRAVAPVGRPAPGPPSPGRAARIAEDERFLLAVLVEQPKAIGEVVDWLRPGDFAVPAHGQLYRCLAVLHHRGEPIDRMTVLWEAQHRGLLADGTLSAEEVGAVCDGIGPGGADWLGEQVIRSSVTRTAAVSARAVRALAEDDSLAPGRLIGHALHALGPLDEVRARWRAATAREAPPVPPPPAEKAAAARVQAALARSSPETATRASARPRPAPKPPATRTSSRHHG
ncbi:DnaB-like helicase N-terminal domain-containing protein [Streptantibioticus parmotrematis]|uniref:DnaB-like helicase N-terminal domain-containing protein n=1 Tax=Streptantibioticus parmotrematis TaxID=2873249 RepID=UPI0033C50C7F